MFQTRTLTQVKAQLNGGLIASCQPVPVGPMDKDEIVLAMALACQAGGAAAVRIEGVRRVQLVADALRIPVIGIVKRDLPDSLVRITPFIADVIALAKAGACIIAVDATTRRRPTPVQDLLSAITSNNALAMADCATVGEGLTAHNLGFEFIGSTLSGYTADTACSEDAPAAADMVTALSAAGCWVIAEGRIRSAADAAAARRWGANAVTVGSALTRLEWMVNSYVTSMGMVE